MIRNLQPDPYSRARPRWSLYTNVTEDPADGRRIYSCADATQQLWVFSVLWHELQFETAIDTTVKLLGSALYTPEDWMLVQEMADTGVLRIPWFAVPNSGSGEIGPQPVLMP